MSNRPEKNSERVEVRATYTLKQRFLNACKTAGQTPSEALRDAMADYILRVEAAGKPTFFQELSMKLIHNPLKTAGMALTSLAAFALIAAPSSADERLFKALDSNGDGVLTETDTAPLEKVIFVLDKDDSESITLDEFRTIARYGRIFVPEKASGKIALLANKVLVNEGEGRAEYKGDVDIEWSDDDSGAFTLGKDSQAIGTLVTIDLSEPGEVRFETQKMTLDEMSGVSDLDHLAVEVESDLLARGRETEAETP